MSTPTKPGRVEVGARFRHKDYGEWGEFTVVRRLDNGHWVGTWSGLADQENVWSESSLELCCALVAPAPATPGTATVTPAPGQRWRDEWDGREIIIGERLPTSNGRWRWALLDNPGCGYLEHYFTDGRLTYLGPGPSKHPASPVYGRMVGELRAPDGTPRTALEAIQAKREPEPWVPAVDEWDLLPDVDVRYQPRTLEQKLGYLVEECGEVLAAVGKTQRWGLMSVNPELPPKEQETNRQWLLRELTDLTRAIRLIRSELVGRPFNG